MQTVTKPAAHSSNLAKDKIGLEVRLSPGLKGATIMKRVLLIGDSGRLGRELAPRFQAAGYVESESRWY